jgi:hypothetical protein
VYFLSVLYDPFYEATRFVFFAAAKEGVEADHVDWLTKRLKKTIRVLHER